MARLKRSPTKKKGASKGRGRWPFTAQKKHAPLESAHILIGAAQSAGIERPHNEDAFFTLYSASAGEAALPDFGLFVVADGMGGHLSGEVASALSVRTVAHHLTQEYFLDVLQPASENAPSPLHDIVRHALEQANQVVVQQAPGSGTTLSVVVLLGEHLTIGHVGDSRVYIIDDGEAKSITRDHSFVERMRELGRLTPEEAEIHPQRNVLYRAIGQGPNLEVDVFTHPVPHGGYLLICSDGLWGVVSQEEIRDLVVDAGHPQAACDRLVHAANQAGGPDNITAVLIYFPPS